MIFPRLWLKQAFLLYNRLKIHTLDRLIFSVYRPAETEVLLRKEKNPFLELNISLLHLTKDIRAGFGRWTDPNWTQDQYIVSIRRPDIFIEGTHGWALVAPNRLVYESLGFARAPYVHKPALTEVFFRKTPDVYLPKVISLRDTGEENYFHFFNDVAAKIHFLDERGLLDQEAWLVVGKNLAQKEYFRCLQCALHHRNFKWHVQDERWIRTDYLLVCKPFTHTVKFLLKTAALIAGQPAQATGCRKIFLTRPRTTGRFIENEAEVTLLLSQHGYEKTDTACMDMEQQAGLFRQATHVVAVHGAGIANILFRYPRPLHLVEIFHDNDYLPFHYVMLASQLNFPYQAVRGRPGHQVGSGGFRVDLNELRSAL
jgi:hypothetical protein